MEFVSRRRFLSASALAAGGTVGLLGVGVPHVYAGEERTRCGPHRIEADHKVMTWGELRSGDMRAVDSRLIFRRNGEGEFQNTIWTAHSSSGDIWHIRFHVLGVQDRFLFDVHQFNFGRIWPRDGRRTYTGAFHFDPHHYDAIHLAEAVYSG